MNVKKINTHFAQPIGFMTCSGESVFLCLVLLFFMGLTMILLNLFVYSQLYQHSSHCYPALFYFGQKEGCKQTITSWANIQSQKNAYTGNLPKTVIDMANQTPTQPAKTGAETCNIELFDTFTQPKGFIQWFSQIWNNYVDILENMTNNIHEMKYRLFAEFVYPHLL